MGYILCFIISIITSTITSAYISIKIGNIVGINHINALDKEWKEALDNFMEEVRRMFKERCERK